MEALSRLQSLSLVFPHSLSVEAQVAQAHYNLQVGSMWVIVDRCDLMHHGKYVHTYRVTYTHAAKAWCGSACKQQHWERLWVWWACEHRYRMFHCGCQNVSVCS